MKPILKIAGDIVAFRIYSYLHEVLKERKKGIKRVYV